MGEVIRKPWRGHGNSDSASRGFVGPRHVAPLTRRRCNRAVACLGRQTARNRSLFVFPVRLDIRQLSAGSLEAGRLAGALSDTRTLCFVSEGCKFAFPGGPGQIARLGVPQNKPGVCCSRSLRHWILSEGFRSQIEAFRAVATCGQPPGARFAGLLTVPIRAICPWAIMNAPQYAAGSAVKNEPVSFLAWIRRKPDRGTPVILNRRLPGVISPSSVFSSHRSAKLSASLGP